MRSIQSSPGSRSGEIRDRRGRGVRGPLALPSALAPDGVPAQRAPSAAFDKIAVGVVERLRARFPDEMDAVDVGVEDCPLLPDDWEQPVPDATCVAGDGSARARLVLFRRPLMTHARGSGELATFIHDAVVEQLHEQGGSGESH